MKIHPSIHTVSMIRKDSFLWGKMTYKQIWQQCENSQANIFKIKKEITMKNGKKAQEITWDEPKILDIW